MLERSVRIRYWLPLVLVAILLVLQVFSPARAILFVLVDLSGALLLSYLWAVTLSRRVSVQRLRRYGWAQVGDVIQERWTMHNDALVPLLWAHVHEHSDLLGYDATRAVGMGPRSSQQWITQGICRMRGVYTLGPLVVTMGDPFGFFEARLVDRHSDTFVVYPPVVDLPELLEERGIDRGSGRASARSLAATPNASSTRPYVRGDALKWIHWRSTARRSLPGAENLQVKIFDREPSGDLWVVLDMDARSHAGRGEESTEEYSVVLASSLAGQMLQANRAVGLISHTAEPILVPPGKGHDQLWELLRALAPVYAVSEVGLHHLLHLAMPLLDRNTSVVVITASADPAWIDGLGMLLARGITPSVMLVDGASFGGGASVTGVQGALADLRVPAHVIRKGMGLRRETRPNQNPQFQVLGTGRVTVVNPRAQGEWVPVGAPLGDQR